MQVLDLILAMTKATTTDKVSDISRLPFETGTLRGIRIASDFASYQDILESCHIQGYVVESDTVL